MNHLIKEKMEGIRTLCAKYRVSRLDLFGSAATDEHFDSDASDLDFLVEFLSLGEGEYADAYFGLLEGLEELFGKSVDLVVERAVRNPYFRESIDKKRVVLYAA